MYTLVFDAFNRAMSTRVSSPAEAVKYRSVQAGSLRVHCLAAMREQAADDGQSIAALLKSDVSMPPTASSNVDDLLQWAS